MAETHETPNSVTLGSLQYIIDGQVLVQPANSFAEGIRQGTPDYGDIDHAFYKSYEDFRGGMATKYGIAREDVDVFQESESIRTWLNKGGITLAPVLTQVTIGAIVPSYYYEDVAFEEGIVGGTNHLWMGIGNTILRYSGSAPWVDDSPTVKPTANTTYSLYEWTNQAGDRHLYWAPGFANTSTFALTDPGYYRRDMSVVIANGAAWADVTAGIEKAHDFISFDKKLLKCYYGAVKASTNGISWTNINIDIPGVPNQFIAHKSKFVGIAQAADGSLKPYMLRSMKLYVIDIFTQDYAEVETGLFAITDAVVYQDEIAVTDNHSIKLVHPRRPIRDIGLPSFKDAFSTWSTNLTPAFLKLATWGPYLIAYTNMGDAAAPTTKYFHVWLHNGSGWHNISTLLNGTINNAIQGGSAIGKYKGTNVLTIGKELWFASASAAGGLAVRTYQVPNADGILNVAVIANRAASGFIITPWFDGGFLDMEGTALELTLHSRDLVAANEQIEVLYQLDGTETTWLSAGLEDIGLFTSSPIQTKRFGASAGTLGQGLSFKSIRFRITLTRRAGDTTKTPILNALLFKWVKRPNIRARYRFNIDIEQTLRIRPVNTSRQSLIDELYAFVDDNPLTPFIYTGETQRWVLVVSMPRRDFLGMPYDDKKSTITVDLLEPV